MVWDVIPLIFGPKKHFSSPFAGSPVALFVCWALPVRPFLPRALFSLPFWFPRRPVGWFVVVPTPVVVLSPWPAAVSPLPVASLLLSLILEC